MMRRVRLMTLLVAIMFAWPTTMTLGMSPSLAQAPQEDDWEEDDWDEDDDAEPEEAPAEAPTEAQTEAQSYLAMENTIRAPF